MKTTTQTAHRTVTNVTMPPCSYGFRSGFARAIVDGIRMELHTSRHASTDPAEHLRDVTAQFARGEGRYPTL